MIERSEINPIRITRKVLQNVRPFYGANDAAVGIYTNSKGRYLHNSYLYLRNKMTKVYECEDGSFLEIGFAR
jgi:hypothetical protein